VLANNATLAGQVTSGLGPVGGLSGVHQFVKVGAHAFVGFASHVSQDVPPYMMVDGNPLAVRASTSRACAGAASRRAHRRGQADAPLLYRRA
jgi:acyl-[acyl carrier protein]--UDP-N-acetylglucosamine O-acyltransferase